MSLGFQGSPLLALILSLGIRFSRYGCRFFFLNLPMGLSGLEPPTSRLSGVRSNQLSYKPSYCPMAVPSGDGDKEIRTLDPLLARQVLSQLS